MKPTFFKTPADLRQWFEEHHDSEQELSVGFYKVGSGKPSVTWPEAVDEALCFGWIDGVRHSLGETAYRIRFTPRKPKSYWSSVNLKKAEVLIAQGRMHAKGIAAFQARDPSGERKYAFEKGPRELEEPYLSRLKQNAKAAAFHEARPPGYRQTIAHWIMSAKAEETRQRRLQELIDSAARGESLRSATPPAKRTGEAAKSRAKPKKPAASKKR